MAFDEAYYLESNPEVAEAVRRGEWSSGYVHYCVLGKARGMAASPPVDAAWYLASYPCVARDIAEGRAVSPTEHYDRLGRFRGYLPSPAAHRPDNPSATHSRFGGLWTDAGNVLDVIAGRLDLGLVSATQAAMLTAWVSNGYVVLPAAISTDILDRAEEDLDRAYHGDFPDLRFNVRSVGQRCPWSKETLEQPTKALDLHCGRPAGFPASHFRAPCPRQPVALILAWVCAERAPRLRLRKLFPAAAICGLLDRARGCPLRRGRAFLLRGQPPNARIPLCESIQRLRRGSSSKPGTGPDERPLEARSIDPGSSARRGLSKRDV